MNKRIRKKRRIGEFREDCFDLHFRVDASISLQDVDKLTDNFIAMIEQNQLQFGGGGQYDWSGIVQGPWRGSVTQEDREAVLDWLRQSDKIVACSGGPLKDLWR